MLKMYKFKKMTSLFVILSIIFTTLLCFAGCAKYDKSDFIGKTSLEIEDEYGSFDHIIGIRNENGLYRDEDGLYRNCSCGYIIEEERVGFLGTDPAVYYYIIFNENGVAVNCEEGYRPGG